MTVQFFFSILAFQFNPKSLSQPPSVTVNHGLSNLDSSTAKLLAHNIFNDADSLSQFRRGLEEATRFLPPGPKLVAGLDSKGEEPINTLGENSYGSKGRKNHERVIEHECPPARVFCTSHSDSDIDENPD